MSARTILPEGRILREALASLFARFSLHYLAITALAGAALVLVLFVFVTIIDAVIQLCGSIAGVWNASNSIERLIILGIAWVILYKSLPYVARFARQKGY